MKKEMDYWRLSYCTLCALATTEIQINIQKMLFVIVPHNGKNYFLLMTIHFRIG